MSGKERKNTVLVVSMLAAGFLLLWADSTLASEDRRPSIAEPGPAAASNLVRQFETMRDPVSDERLHYQVHEVAEMSGVAEERIRESIATGGLCVIRVNGVAFIPASFARAYIKRVAPSHHAALEAPTELGPTTGGS